jgi:hypothetical protein
MLQLTAGTGKFCLTLKKKPREDTALSVMEKPSNIAGGLVVMTIGAGFMMFERDLGMGTLFRMGPGCFPTILSAS